MKKWKQMTGSVSCSFLTLALQNKLAQNDSGKIKLLIFAGMINPGNYLWQMH
jgi:hypothetical protein